VLAPVFDELAEKSAREEAAMKAGAILPALGAANLGSAQMMHPREGREGS
jgi:hypothetical protein